MGIDPDAHRDGADLQFLGRRAGGAAAGRDLRLSGKGQAAFERTPLVLSTGERDCRPATGDRRLPTGDRRPATGDWRLATGDWRLFYRAIIGDCLPGSALFGAYSSLG